MSWEIAVALKIFGGSVLAPIVFRLLGDVPPRERIYRIMLQYAWTILFAMAVALIWGFAPSSDLGPIVAIGALMPFAVFFQWRAMAISPSRTGIFMEGTGIIPLLMSAILLDEWKVLGENQPLLLGFALVLISVVLHTFADIARKQEKGKQISPTAGFLRNSVSFMLIFSVATFLQNYWAKTSIHTSEFLVAWYVGASAGSIILFMATRHLPRSTTSTQMSFKKENFLIFLAGVSIVCSLGLQFIAFTLVEQTIALPIMSVGGLFGPILVGMFVFKEWKIVKGWAWFYLGIGFIGALLMALSH